MIGLLGAAAGPSFDMAVAPTGEAVAYRAADGKLAVIGRGRNVFATEQWLRADADGRPATEALAKSRCDKLGCVGTLGGGKIIALILDRAAFAEDCTRADIVVTPLFAPRRPTRDRSRQTQRDRRADPFLWEKWRRDAGCPRGGRRPPLVTRAQTGLGQERAAGDDGKSGGRPNRWRRAGAH
jgi:hypothetical protein